MLDTVTIDSLDRICSILSAELKLTIIPGTSWGWDRLERKIIIPRGSLLERAAVDVIGKLWRNVWHAARSIGQLNEFDIGVDAAATAEAELGVRCVHPNWVLGVIMAAEQERVESLARASAKYLGESYLPVRWTGARANEAQIERAIIFEDGTTGNAARYWERIAMTVAAVAADQLTHGQLPADMPWTSATFERVRALPQASSFDALMTQVESLVTDFARAQLEALTPPPEAAEPAEDEGEPDEDDADASQSQAAGEDETSEDSEADAGDGATDADTDDNADADTGDQSDDATDANDEDDDTSRGDAGDSGDSDDAGNDVDDTRDTDGGGGADENTAEDESNHGTGSADAAPSAPGETDPGTPAPGAGEDADVDVDAQAPNGATAPAGTTPNSSTTEPSATATPIAVPQEILDAIGAAIDAIAEGITQIDWFEGDANATPEQAAHDFIEAMAEAIAQSQYFESAPAWSAVSRTNAAIVEPLRRTLLEFLAANDTGEMERHQRRGRLDVRAIAKPEPDPRTSFSRRVTPVERSYAIALVVDRSGSTRSSTDEPGVEEAFGPGPAHVWQLGARLVVGLTEALQRIDHTELSIIAFDDDVSLVKSVRDRFTDERKSAAMSALIPSGGTIVAPAITTALDDLAKSNASEKLVIVLTDGEFCESESRAISNAVLRADREHVGVAVLTVGCPATSAARFVGEKMATEITPQTAAAVVRGHFKRLFPAVAA